MKTEFKGTHGVWTTDSYPDGLHGIWKDEAIGYELPTLVARTCYAPNSEANANLISAAPDLLAFAIDFVEKVESGRAKSTDSYNKAKNAINKALNIQS